MAKISLGPDPVAEGIYGDQSHRMLIDGIMDESVIRHDISVDGKSPHHSVAAVAIAGGDVERRFQRLKQRPGVGEFCRPPVLGYIAGVDDGVGQGVEVVNVGDACAKVLRPRAEFGIRRVDVREMGVGNLAALSR